MVALDVRPRSVAQRQKAPTPAGTSSVALELRFMEPG